MAKLKVRHPLRFHDTVLSAVFLQTNDWGALSRLLPRLSFSR
jgi:hypothetical protein